MIMWQCIKAYSLIIAGDQNSEDEPGSSDNGSSTAVSEQPRASLSHQVLKNH